MARIYLIIKNYRFTGSSEEPGANFELTRILFMGKLYEFYYGEMDFSILY